MAASSSEALCSQAADAPTVGKIRERFKRGPLSAGFVCELQTATRFLNMATPPHLFPTKNPAPSKSKDP